VEGQAVFVLRARADAAPQVVELVGELRRHRTSLGRRPHAAPGQRGRRRHPAQLAERRRGVGHAEEREGSRVLHARKPSGAGPDFGPGRGFRGANAGRKCRGRRRAQSGTAHGFQEFTAPHGRHEPGSLPQPRTAAVNGGCRLATHRCRSFALRRAAVKLKISDFRVPEGKNVDLVKWPTDIAKLYKTDEEYRERLDSDTAKLDDLQRLQYAHDRYAVLAIFQAMDGAGKDGAIRHVLSGINPQGFQVYSFKQPSVEELDHDFLWRTWRCMPERGRLGIFNRSYYEEVLVVRVHPEILEAQKLPPALVTRKIWKERYQDIRAFERYLAR